LRHDLLLQSNPFGMTALLGFGTTGDALDFTRFRLDSFVGLSFEGHRFLVALTDLKGLLLGFLRLYLLLGRLSE